MNLFETKKHYTKTLWILALLVMFSSTVWVQNGSVAGRISDEMSTNSSLTAKANREAVAFYTGSNFKTHFINYHNNTGDAKDELWEELG